MPNVQMPNGDVVSFPDDMPREQIKGLIATKFPDAIKGMAAKPKVDAFDTVSDNFLQGFTLGLGNRAQAGLAAGALALADKRPFMDTVGDYYKKAREVGSQRLSAEMEQHPILAVGSNIAGALATGGLASGTKAGAAIGNSLRAGSTAARIGKGALAGSVSGAAYGAGTADYGKSGEGAVKGAISGGVVGGLIPGAGALASSAKTGVQNAIKGYGSRGVEQLDDALAAIKDRSSQAYQAMRDAGAIINKPRAVNIANRVEYAVKSGGALNPRLHSTTIGLLEDFKDAARTGEMSLDDLDKWRQTFGQVASNFNDKLNQRNASIAIDAIDDAVSGLGKIDIRGGKTEAINALNVGRQEWARARKFEKIAAIVNNSKGDANYLKRELAKLAANPKKFGFNESERAALNEAAKQTFGEGMLKSLGKFGFDFGAETRLGNTALPVGTAALGAPGLTAAGTAARTGQKLVARGKAENLLNVIEGTTKNLPAKTGGSVSPALSAPAGAVAGAISGAETRTPMRQMPQITVTPQDALPEVNLPQVSPRSDNTNFDKAVNFVFDIEGGYVADDAGKGATNLGVNKTANPDVKIASLQKPEARKIYKQRYWNAINADKLPPQLALVGFDAAVNHGVSKVRELLKKSGGDPLRLLKLREMEYARLVRSNPKKYAQYAQGWIDRLHKLQTTIS